MENFNLNFSEVVIEEPIIPVIENIEKPDNEIPLEKKKRGRPKKSESNYVNSEKKSSPKIDIFDQLKKDIEDNKSNINNDPIVSSGNSVTENPTEQKNVINGYMLLLIADLFFPALIKIIFKKASKDIKIQELQLSENQKASLEPLSDAVASQVLGYIDPLTLFFIVTGGTYYQNFEALKDAKSNINRR